MVKSPKNAYLFCIYNQERRKTHENITFFEWKLRNGYEKRDELIKIQIEI